MKIVKKNPIFQSIQNAGLISPDDCKARSWSTRRPTHYKLAFGRNFSNTFDKLFSNKILLIIKFKRCIRF